EYYLNSTTETQLRDAGAININDKRFYSVVATIELPALMHAAEAWEGQTKAFVLEQIQNMKYNAASK
ncbi:hypothetical protein KKG66_07800, partial [bacterium]|nr:hypothetical protein [bacterium]